MKKPGKEVRERSPEKKPGKPRNAMVRTPSTTINRESFA